MRKLAVCVTFMNEKYRRQIDEAAAAAHHAVHRETRRTDEYAGEEVEDLIVKGHKVVKAQRGRERDRAEDEGVEKKRKKRDRLQPEDALQRRRHCRQHERDRGLQGAVALSLRDAPGEGCERDGVINDEKHAVDAAENGRLVIGGHIL